MFTTLTFPSTQILLIGKAALACLLTSSLWQKNSPCRIFRYSVFIFYYQFYLPLAYLVLLSWGFETWGNLHHFFLSIITNIGISIYSRYSLNTHETLLKHSWNTHERLLKISSNTLDTYHSRNLQETSLILQWSTL